MRYDAIVLGGGAAGLFFAARAGQRGKKVLVVERNAEVGRKILISGGGRCNFTNLNCSIDNFLSQNRHFAKSALARFSPADFIGLVRRHHIRYYEKKLGQLFCTESSRSIVKMLTDECLSVNARILTGCGVSEIRSGAQFEVFTSRGVFQGGNVIVATGGLSFPKIGATDLGYRIALQFGHKIVPTRPSLVGMRLAASFSPNLAGIAVPARVEAAGHEFHENVLFTHRGLSGPAIIQASNYWQPGSPIRIDMDPDAKLETVLKSGRPNDPIQAVLKANLPLKLAQSLSAELALPRHLAEMSAIERERLIDRVRRWQVNFTDTEGYNHAEVTLGGISTDEISSSSMESKRMRGLYFVGEALDITGWLGGYNFQWAWASAAAAADSLK